MRVDETKFTELLKMLIVHAQADDARFLTWTLDSISRDVFAGLIVAKKRSES